MIDSICEIIISHIICFDRQKCELVVMELELLIDCHKRSQKCIMIEIIMYI